MEAERKAQSIARQAEDKAKQEAGEIEQSMHAITTTKSNWTKLI